MSSNPIKFRMQIFFIIFAIVLFTGTFGFMITEKLSFADAVYFTIVTVSTVGYGDVHPTSSASKIITIVLIIMGVGTFVGFIGNATELILYKREKHNRLKKINMVTGVFFSELGTRLLSLFCKVDNNLHTVREKLIIKKDSPDAHFMDLSDQLMHYKSKINAGALDLNGLRKLLNDKKDFILRLLENPHLIEDEAFTGILWAVLHLAEELNFRDDFEKLPETDINHLSGDIERVYNLIIVQWVEYMKHLKEMYPYLFSLSIRINPFDREASVVIK
ncbi:MAG: two pore domain potassium channel family protein [Endomicrobiales bacterium]|nr:two pore domain potassium channel family protein [Endomicrobiales bacterium]